MAYFTSLQNYIDSVTARFNKPKRSLLNDGIVKQDIIDALTDTAKYADDVKAAGEAINGSFINRSLNLSSIIYVDGVNGNDIRTGTTNDNNAVTGRVKTLTRVAQLHSGKTAVLIVEFSNTVTINADVTIRVPDITFTTFAGGSKLQFLRNATNNGNYRLFLGSDHVSIYDRGPGISIETEGHGGNVLAEDTATYNSRQGAILFLKSWTNDWAASKRQYLYVSNVTINAGNNTLVFAGTQNGANTVTSLKGTEAIFQNPMVTLGTNAKLDWAFNYGFIRDYTPTSSTDANLFEKEFCSNGNYLYQKYNGIIKKIAWTAF